MIFKNALTALVMTLPMVISATIHMIIVKNNLFSIAKKPVHLRYFGSNKTWRGFFIMPLLTIFSYLLTTLLVKNLLFDFIVFNFDHGILQNIFIGFLLGLAYVLFELPNSFLKRKLNIPPGKLPTQNVFFFSLLDRIDSAIGCGLVYVLFTNASIQMSSLMIFLSPFVHFILVLLAYAVGIKKTPY